MAPSIPMAEVPEQEVIVGRNLETHLLEVGAARAEKAPAGAARPRQSMEGSFRSSMLEYNRMKSSSRLVDTIISLTVNIGILLVPVFAGLYFTDSLDMRQFASIFLVAPPPPPPFWLNSLPRRVARRAHLQMLCCRRWTRFNPFRARS